MVVREVGVLRNEATGEVLLIDMSTVTKFLPKRGDEVHLNNDDWIVLELIPINIRPFLAKDDKGRAV